jgi:pyridoxal phosphate enzyme (YggS family)
LSDIVQNIITLKSQIPQSVKLIAVSKTKSVADIMAAYSAGQRLFGENRVPELLGKKDQLPEDIEWHFIGHLQTNKAKVLAPFITLIHSIDSLKLLSVINAEAAIAGRIIDCLLQVHIADEETKYGFVYEDLIEMLDKQGVAVFQNVRICGVMGMATFTNDDKKVRQEFAYLKSCFNDLRTRYFSDKPYFKELSMGMSGDYHIAIEEGSTMIRIGSNIFGERNLNI